MAKLGLSDCPYESWTLARNDRQIRCTLTPEEDSGTYVLRVVYGERLVLTESCESPEGALARSIETFLALAAHGWVPKK